MGQSASHSSPAAPMQASSCPIDHTKPAECPVDHKAMAAAKPAECPVDHTAMKAASSKPAECPVDHNAISSLNQMPTLTQDRAPGQMIDLPMERTQSSIKRDSSGTKWDYPSPQQFYNALVRKGWETPEEHIETMVDIHNFLNERAWNEVIAWERRAQDDADQLELTRFKGRPGEFSPKARFWMLAGTLFPSQFNSEPPFDRHDWIIRRPKTGEEVRYVIDYYSAPPEPDGSPVFSLDVRPALDSFASIRQRIAMATEEAWTSFREPAQPTTSH